MPRHRLHEGRVRGECARCAEFCDEVGAMFGILHFDLGNVRSEEVMLSLLVLEKKRNTSNPRAK